jgi:hypothetical protein
MIQPFKISSTQEVAHSFVLHTATVHAMVQMPKLHKSSKNCITISPTQGPSNVQLLHEILLISSDILQ